MGDIVKFSGAGEIPTRKFKPVDEGEARLGRKEFIFALLMGAVNLLRVPLFLFMYWLRVPIQIVCRFISGVGMAGLVIAWFVYPVPKMLWAFGIASFLAFVLMWVYDFALMFLSPQDMVKVL